MHSVILSSALGILIASAGIACSGAGNIEEQRIPSGPPSLVEGTDPAGSETAPPREGTVDVTIAGTRHVFEGVTARPHRWTENGAPRTGFAVSAAGKDGFTLAFYVYADAPGTYSCTGDAAKAALSWGRRGTGAAREGALEYGTSPATQTCAVTVIDVGTRPGDRFRGTFAGDLGLSWGESSTNRVTFTQGRFELTLAAD